MSKSATITGTVVLGHTNQIPGHEDKPKTCICCPGFPSHVHSITLALDDYVANRTLKPRQNDLGDWIHDRFDLKGLEGKRIRITAELVDDAN